jgi:putative oxidoreductase
MNLFQEIKKRSIPRYEIMELFFRVLTGIIIAIKGIVFMSHYGYLDELIRYSPLYRFADFFWVYYIALADLVCGVFLAFGLLTRVSIILQLPLMAGAFFFITPGGNGFSLNGEWVLSLFMLCLLFYFLIRGAGDISMDRYLDKWEW